MTAVLLTVGDEILLGQIVDTNAAWLGDRLAASGVDLVRHETVGDTMDAITGCLARACADADLVVLTGGLGPTHDDLTRDAIAAHLGVDLLRHADVEHTLRERYRQRGRDLTETRIRMADVPEGVEPLPNPRGAAPGLWHPGESCVIVAMPGVPYEMKAIWRESVEPRLHELRPGAVVHRTLLTVGKGESDIAADLGDLPALLGDGVGLAFLPSLGTVRIRLTAKGDDVDEARARVDRAAEAVRQRIERLVFGEGDTSLEAVVGEMLAERGLTVAMGESCTGGALAARLTRVPGASRYVLGGVLAYCNSVKENQLGVPEADLAEHGAVSEPVALAMARGARELTGADIGLATTGVAGPTGGTPEKPVGTVWIAYASGEGERAVRLQLSTDRGVNIGLTVTATLDLLRRQLLRRGA
ncbi:MAG TPA: competence/damage-inducible protein A [Bacteroidetes bacterium]|nr:competence/damage-inducible protein A [Bacteroidota bacterium]